MTVNGGMVVKRSAWKPNTTTHQTLSKFHQGPISAIAIMKGWHRQHRSRKGGGGGGGGGASTPCPMTLVVTGDVSNYPTISLWNGETMEPINSTKGVSSSPFHLLPPNTFVVSHIYDPLTYFHFFFPATIDPPTPNLGPEPVQKRLCVEPNVVEQRRRG